VRMRPSLALLSVLTPALLALPVVERPSPSVKPVKPMVATVALAGVDATAATSTPAPPGAPAATAAAERLADAGTGPTGRRTVVLSPQRSADPFAMVGLTWRRAADTGPVEAWVRTRTDGRWSGWSSLGGLADEEPDAGSVEAAGDRVGTSPTYVGRADGVQTRLDVLSGRAPEDVRLELVDPGASDADSTVTTRTAPASSAGAAAGRPGIRSRAEWGADESIRGAAPAYASTLLAATIHHTASSNTYSQAEVPGIIRGFYAYHVKSLGWSDIGYNVLVDKFGTAWEGRYGGLDRPVIGAHAGGFNTATVGVSMIGTHSSATPTAAVQSTVANVVAWKLGLHQRDPRGSVTLTSRGSTRYPNGTQVRLPVVFGHRDVSATDCPGNSGMATLPGMRSAAAAAIGAGFVDPAISEDSSAVTVRAGTMTPLSYELAVTQQSTGAVVRRLTGTASSSVDVAWDRRGERGTALPNGTYRLTLSGGNGSSTAVPWSGTVDVTGSTAQAPRWGPIGTVARSGGTTDLLTRSTSSAVTHRRIENGRLTSVTGLGGIITGAPSGARRGGSVLNVFARGGDDALWANGSTSAGWAGWSSLGGVLTARPSVAASGDNLNVVVRGGDGAVHARYSPAAGAWSPWGSLGGALLENTGPGSTWTSTGRYEVVVVGTDRQLYRGSWTAARGWSTWQPIGGQTTDDVSAGAAVGDEVVVAVRGLDGGAWVRGVGALGEGVWTDLGGTLLSAPSVSSVPNSGVVDVVAVGADGALWRNTRSVALWSGWHRLG
jgi:hypothetical protein